MRAAPDENEPETTMPASGMRPSLAPPRDTLVDPPKRSFLAALRDAGARLVSAFRTPRLTDYLPPRRDVRRPQELLPVLDRAELMLLDLMLAPVEYQRAALRIAEHVLHTRENHPASYPDELVHYAVSRLAPEPDGRIALWRVRSALPSIPYSGDILPALRTLHERQIVELYPPPILDNVPESVQHTHVRLREPL